MINIAPRTYHEVVRLQKCYTLASHYTDITEDVFSRIYRFLGQSERNAVVAGRHIISLVNSNREIVKAFAVTAADDSFDRIEMDQKSFALIPHYHSGGSDSGGTSSNNNNNNNNKNNNNNNNNG